MAAKVRKLLPGSSEAIQRSTLKGKEHSHQYYFCFKTQYFSTLLGEKNKIGHSEILSKQE